MKSMILVALVLFYTVSKSHGSVLCDGTVSGDVNDELLVKGTSCTLSGARVNGLVKVTEGGSLNVESGSTINGGLMLRGADQLHMRGEKGSVILNGNIDDENSIGNVLVIGDVVINGDVKIVNRSGNIEFFPVTVYGAFRFINGSGFSRIQGVKGNPYEIIIHDRGAGMTIVEDTAAISNVDIRGSGFVRLSGTTVYDTASFISNGLDGNAVLIFNVKVNNRVVVEGSGGALVIDDLTVSNKATLNGNLGGIFCSKSKFNFLECEENGEPIEFTDTTISSGEGQCSAM